MHANLRSLFTSALCYTLFLSLSSFAWSTTKTEIQTSGMDNLRSEQQFRQLRSEISQLRKQIQILQKNQEAIAGHVGLKATGSQTTGEQPELKVGESATIGSDNASVVLVEFTDLHCPFCKRFHLGTFPRLNEDYIRTDKLLFVGKHYPITALHKNAFIASKALECSREQHTGDSSFYSKAKTWLFKEGPDFALDEFSSKFQLNSDAFNTCIASSKFEKNIYRDINLAKSVGINSTPSFLIGLHKEGNISDWRVIKGAKKYEQLSQAIDAFIAQANEKAKKQ